MKAKVVLAGALLSLMIVSCEKKEEKAQGTPKGETKEALVKKEERQAEVDKGKEKGQEFKKSGAYALADSKGCFACHDVQKKKVGPAYVEVAKKYAGKENAVEELVRSITKGSMGKWGSIPMTPQPVTREEAERLAKWILSLR